MCFVEISPVDRLHSGSMSVKQSFRIPYVATGSITGIQCPDFGKTSRWLTMQKDCAIWYCPYIGPPGPLNIEFKDIMILHIVPDELMWNTTFDRVPHQLIYLRYKRGRLTYINYYFEENRVTLKTHKE